MRIFVNMEFGHKKGKREGTVKDGHQVLYKITMEK
jgi:hypothetical protein